MRIRVKDLKLQDVFILMNVTYRVTRITADKIYYAPTSGHSRIDIGRNSMQFVILVNVTGSDAGFIYE